MPEYKMSSVGRHPTYTKQGNDFFVNVANLTTVAASGDLFVYNESAGTMTATDFTGATAGALANPTLPGGLLVKDMGKTVTVGGVRYRKVQTFSIGSGVTDTTLAAITYYIALNPATGNGCKFARMTLQA